MLEKEDIDAVSVVVPTLLHHEVASQCMANKKHVLVEKPIASTLEEAQALIVAAKKNGVIFTVGHIERFNPAVQKLKEIIDSGKIGDIMSVFARRVGLAPPKIKDANVIIDLAVHDIDIINYLLGEFPRKHTAEGGKAFMENLHDFANIMLSYPSASAFIQVNWITPVRIRKLNVTGTRGYVELDYIDQEISLYETKFRKKDQWGEGKPLLFDETSENKVDVKKEQPLKRELNHFLDVIIDDDRNLMVTPEQGFEALKTALIVDGLIKK
jgi:UDP-N-acetylglucosamine 3-dehydrogenase